MADSLDPVEIDINMRQNVTEESDRAAQGMNNLSESSRKALEAMEKDVARQTEVIEKMRFVIEELQKQIAATAPEIIPETAVSQLEAARQSLETISQTVDNYQESISSMNEAISSGADVTELMNESAQSLSETQESLVSTMTEVLDAQEEINSGIEDNTEATDENTQSSEKNSVAGKIMGKVVGEVCSQLGIENRQLVTALTNTNNLTAAKGLWARATTLLNTQLGISIVLSKALVAGGIGLIIAGIAAVVIAYREWGESTRIQEKALEQLNKVMDEASQKKQNLESKTTKLISTINSETKTLVEQIAAYRELQNLYPHYLKDIDQQTFKVMGATEQQKMLNKAISDIDVSNKNEEIEKYKKLLDDLDKPGYLDGKLFAQVKARGVLDQGIGDYFMTGDQEVKKIITETIDLLEKEKATRDQIAQEAQFRLKPESEQKMILESQLTELLKQKTAIDSNTDSANNFNKESGKGLLVLQEVKGKSDNITDSVNKWTEQPNALSNIFSKASLQASILDSQISGIKNRLNELNGISSTPVTKNKEYWEKQKKAVESFKDGLDSSTRRLLESGKQTAMLDPQLLKDWEKNNKIIADSKKELKVYEDPEKGLKAAETAARKAATKAAAAQKKQDKSQEDLLRKSEDYQNRIDAARISAMQDGAEKQRATLKAEHDKEKALIERNLRELTEIEKITGKPATAERAQLEALDSAVTAEYETNTNRLNEATQKAIKVIFDDVKQKFQSELDNNLLSINNYYDEQIKAAKQAGANIDQINLLTAAREKEKAQARRNDQINTLSFDTEIALRRMDLASKYYLFESDKIKERVEKQKAAKQQELKILKDQFADTPTKELAQDIAEATVVIEEMDKALKKLSTQKFQELADYANQIAGGISNLLGEDDSLGKMLGWTSDLAGAGAKIASGNPKEMIDGAFKVAGTIKDIFSTASRVRKEIREFYKELEQAAINYSITIINSLKDVKSLNDSLFYTDTSNALAQGMTGYTQAVQKEIDLVSKLGDTTVQVGKKKKKFLGITTGSKTIWEGVLSGYKKVLDTDDELIDKNGQLNRELAESLLNSGKLSKESSNLINQILSAQDAASAAMQQVESTLEKLSGNIGNDLKTALVDAFNDGDALSAAEKFKKSVSKTMEDIITDKMFSAVFGSMMGDLEDRMKQSYGDGGDQDLVDDIMWFYKQSQEGADKFYDQLAKAKEKLKEQGFDILDDSERTASSKGIATASQDSINELNGGVYAMRQTMNDIRNMVKEDSDIQKARAEDITAIKNNTAFCQKLEGIDKSLTELKDRGIKIREQ